MSSNLSLRSTSRRICGTGVNWLFHSASSCTLPCRTTWRPRTISATTRRIHGDSRLPPSGSALIRGPGTRVPCPVRRFPLAVGPGAWLAVPEQLAGRDPQGGQLVVELLNERLGVGTLGGLALGGLHDREVGAVHAVLDLDTIGIVGCHDDEVR